VEKNGFLWYCSPSSGYGSGQYSVENTTQKYPEKEQPGTGSPN